MVKSKGKLREGEGEGEGEPKASREWITRMELGCKQDVDESYARLDAARDGYNIAP